jgi:hypothetical protein
MDAKLEAGCWCSVGGLICVESEASHLQFEWLQYSKSGNDLSTPKY